MKELGVLSHPDYKITAMMDHLAMITVQSESHGVFDCKPLGVLWGKCPEVSICVDGVKCLIPCRLTPLNFPDFKKLYRLMR